MSEKRNLQDIAALLSAKLGISKKEAELFVKETLDSIQDGLLTDKSVKIANLGTLKLTTIAERESVDVTTGNRVVLPAHSKIAFTPDAVLSETVNAPFALFENVEVNEDTEINADDEIEEIEESQGVEAEIVIEEIEAEIVVEEPEVSEEPEQHEVSKEPEEIESEEVTEEIEEFEDENTGKKFSWLWFICALLVLLLGLGAAAYWYYQRDNAETCCEHPMVDLLQPDDEQNSLPKIADTNSATGEPTISAGKTVASGESTANANPYNAVDGTAGAHTYIVKPGERLTLIALREFGNKTFWVYLYQENKDKIPNPDNVGIGTEITIPSPVKYGINAQDTGSVSKAHDLAMKLEEQLWLRNKR